MTRSGWISAAAVAVLLAAGTWVHAQEGGTARIRRAQAEALREKPAAPAEQAQPAQRVRAQAAQGPQAGERARVRQQAGPQEIGGVEWLPLLRQLGLTEEQRAQIAEILADHREEVQAFRTEHAAEIDAIEQELRTAIQNRDREAVRAAREKLQALMGDRRDLAAELREEISEVLTAEQRQRLRRLLAAQVAEGDTPQRPQGDAPQAGPRFELLRGLNLTEDQQAQVRQILEEARTSGNPDARAQAMRRIAQEVLTPEQRAQFIERAGQGRGPGAGMGPGPGAEAPRRMRNHAPQPQ